MNVTQEHFMTPHRMRAGTLCATAVAWVTAGSTYAAEPVGAVVNTTGQSVGSVERFGRHEDSFVIWNHMRNNGWAHSDESALRAHYSFKYSFCGPRFKRKDEVGSSEASASTSGSICPTGKLSKLEVFAAYTGEFDFYLDTRTSGPVINRLSAPGLFVRMPLGVFDGQWTNADNVEIGYEHRSNGQVADVLSAGGARTAAINYAAGNHSYFDTISRGANYISLTLDRRDPLDAPNLDVRAKVRLYVGGQDSNVTWGPLAGSGRRFSSYDRLELRASYRLSDTTADRFEVEWRVGDKGLATDSWTLGFVWNLGEVPLYLRVHRGPMNTLANYTQRQDSVGFGLMLARF